MTNVIAMEKPKPTSEFKVGMEVEWVGKGRQHRRGTITAILKTMDGKPAFAKLQPEEVSVPLSDLTLTAK